MRTLGDWSPGSWTKPEGSASPGEPPREWSRTDNDRVPIRLLTGALSAPGPTMWVMAPLGSADSLRGRPDSWSAAVWLVAVAAICGIADFGALPDGEVWFGLPLDGNEMFRPAWLVAGTLVAFPLFRLARASLVLGVLGLVLSAGEMFTIVDNARERFVHNFSLFDSGPSFSPAYYALAAVQSVIFAAAVSAGLRRRWADRRWERMMRRLTTTPPQPVPPTVAPTRLDATP